MCNEPATKTVRIIIYVDGGIVQDVLADGPGVEAMIVDYDNERAGESKSARAFESITVNPKYIEKTIQGVED